MTFFKYPNKDTGKYWIHVHESIDGIPRLVLHTYQLSQPSKDYIRGVVEICRISIFRHIFSYNKASKSPTYINKKKILEFLVPFPTCFGETHCYTIR